MASMPFLSMVRIAAAETRSFTQRFSLATQNRRSCRFGRKRRRVLFIACETLLPVVVRLPVTWQTRDIAHLGNVVLHPMAWEAAAPVSIARMSTTRFGQEVPADAGGSLETGHRAVRSSPGPEKTGVPDAASRAW